MQGLNVPLITPQIQHAALVFMFLSIVGLAVMIGIVGDRVVSAKLAKLALLTELARKRNWEWSTAAQAVITIIR